MFKKITTKKAKSRKNKVKLKMKSNRIEIPQGLYNKCDNCQATLNTVDIKLNHFKCIQCNHHFRIRANERIALIFDHFEEFNHSLTTQNILDFPDYTQKIEALQIKEGIKEAVITGYASINGQDVIGIVMDPYFLMGSMGSVVGEKIVRAFDIARRLNYPVVSFNASGGARMQEGMYSLMQMAKTSAAVGRFHNKGGLYISVLTDPTTGGVTASFATLGDIILAEPNSLIGFAGPRVIEQTIKETLPEGFQKAEFLLEKGFIDKVVDRKDLKKIIGQILKMHEVR